MTLDPLLSASAPVPLHAAAAVAALLLGVVQLVRPKGGLTHRVAGWLWVGLMAVVAASGLFIHEIRLIGPFSPIHLLSLLTLATLVGGVQAARRGDIARHRKAMRMLFFLALVVTGAFTLLPGRVMYQVVTGG